MDASKSVHLFGTTTHGSLRRYSFPLREFAMTLRLHYVPLMQLSTFNTISIRSGPEGVVEG